MSNIPSVRTVNTEKQNLVSSANLSEQPKSNLTRLAAWISDHNLPFPICQALADCLTAGRDNYNTICISREEIADMSMVRCSDR